MRDPERIDRMIEKLRVIWKARPDLRLTQLTSCAANNGGWNRLDTFSCEDDVTELGLDEMVADLVKAMNGEPNP